MITHPGVSWHCIPREATGNPQEESPHKRQPRPQEATPQKREESNPKASELPWALPLKTTPSEDPQLTTSTNALLINWNHLDNLNPLRSSNPTGEETPLRRNPVDDIDERSVGQLEPRQPRTQEDTQSGRDVASPHPQRGWHIRISHPIRSHPFERRCCQPATPAERGWHIKMSHPKGKRAPLGLASR